MLDYAPQPITADTLDDMVEFDSPFLINGDGTAELSGNFAPNVYGEQGQNDPEIEASPKKGWEFMRGYTGQYGYNGPEMHTSEFLGGRMAEDIVNTPGEYAVVAVQYLCDEFCGFCDDETHLESWAVIRRNI